MKLWRNLFFILACGTLLLATDQKTIIDSQLSLVTENTAENWVAEVNDEKVTIGEFNKAIENAKANLLKQDSIDFNTEEGQFILSTTKRSIIEDLIKNKLIKQQMKKMNIEVTEQDIVDRIKALKKSFPSEKLFLETLADEGIDENELHKGIREQVIVQKIKNELTKKIVISEREINSFLKHNKEFSAPRRRVQLSQIITASKDDAEIVLAKLKDGEPFASLAEKYSIDPVSKDTGGNIGFIEEGTLEPDAERVIFELKEGQLSPITLTNEGFAIYKCTQILNGNESTAGDPKEEARKFLLSKKDNEIYDKSRKVRAGPKIKINEKIIPQIHEDLSPGDKLPNNLNISNESV
jgi:foldase protein PrsA